MKYYQILLLLVLMFSTFDTSAQEGCGFVESSDFMNRMDQLKVERSLKTTASNDTIPLAIHLVANDDGLGRYAIGDIMADICELNETFESVGIYFWVQWPIHFIDNTSYFDHSFTDGYSMMQSNNIGNALNAYVVSDPAGNCGYYSYGPDALALAISCLGPGQQTFSHELGHMLNLPHPFRGWENGQTPTNPELVTRGTGANCNSAGDRLCDTEADYLAFRWNCNYQTALQDPTGVTIDPDSSLIMAYSNDDCATRFSPQQITVMNNDKDDRWPFLDNGYPSRVDSFEEVELLNIGDTLYQDKKIVWNPVANASAYYIQICPQQAPNFVRFDTLIYNDNEMIISKPNFGNGAKYLVRIRPINETTLCHDDITVHNFIYQNTPNPNYWPDAVNEVIASTQFSATSRDGSVFIHHKADIAQNAQIRILDILGRTIHHTEIQLESGQHTSEISNLFGFKEQIIFVQIITQEGDQTIKLIMR